MADREDGLREWLDSLPDTVAQVSDRWSLELGDPYRPGGTTSWVAPARTAAGDELVLKVGWRHPESMHEADGLRQWDGRGVVRLHACHEDDDTVALLLERCAPGHPLGRRPELAQDAVMAALLPRLWREPAPGHRFRPLGAMCHQWADSFERKVEAGTIRIDRGLAREGAALFRSLPDSAERSLLLCTDLHAGNVLAARREPWLVIDPKPYVGDPTYDPLQHMLNCGARLRSDPKALIGRMADLLALDGERLRLWTFARCVVDSGNQADLAEVAACLGP